MPLVMVTSVETFEQAPDAAKLTAPVPLPPVDPTVKLAFNSCAVAGIPVTVSAAWLVKAAAAVATAEVALLKLLSAALKAVTEQVPVPLVMVTSVETLEQAPDAAKLTAPVPLPPVDPTAKVAFNTCAVAGMPVTVSAPWLPKAAATVAAAEVALL